MPTSPTYPGVYIEEVPSDVRTITGVATSIAAFIGRATRGPLNDPVRVQSYAEFALNFGGLARDSMMSYAVQHYFLNGGSDALVVRVVGPNAGATRYNLPAGGGNLTLDAANPGEWGDNLEIFIDYDTRDPADTNLFNLTINEVVDGATVATENHRNVSIDSNDSRYLPQVLEQQSNIVVVFGAVTTRPDLNGLDGEGNPVPPAVAVNGANGDAIGFDQIADPNLSADNVREGLWALDKADLFNLMCIPPFDRATDVDEPTWTNALAYCKSRRAMLIVDPPSQAWFEPSSVLDATVGVDGTNRPVPARDENAALYYPRVQMADALNENRLESFAPCGVVAGIFARTDGQRGVWKAPAGQDASLVGVRGLDYKMTDGENGRLNPMGVNCLRTFPVSGNVIWGSRTMEGADSLASEWKYVPVRRITLFIEESLYRGTQWVVFEPNDEPLWAQIRLNIGAFMQNLFRQGAFQGSTPREAYLVKCDRETTTQNDINAGIVNIVVGFAPLKPAEFVIIKIQQLAGQIQT
jgi:hypothetical protein